MIRIRSEADVHASGLPPSLRSLLARRFGEMIAEFRRLGAEYDPDDDGEFVVLEPGEESLPLAAIPAPAVREMTLEAVVDHPEAGCFEASYIPGNSWALEVFVPDTEAYDTDLREWLRAQAVVPGGGGQRP